jgi:hypothetical protein
MYQISGVQGMKMTSIFFLFSFVLSLTFGLQVGLAQPNNEDVVVRTLKNSPVSIRSAKLSRIENQQVLLYSVDATRSGYDEFEFLALTVSSTGEVKGGQGWRIKVDEEISPISAQSMIINNKLSPSDKLVVSIVSFKGRKGIIPFNPATTVKEMLVGSDKLSLQSSDANLLKATSTILNSDDICTVRSCEARNTCGCGGVSTFSCNPETGAYSFGCHPRNGCNDPLPEACGDTL